MSRQTLNLTEPLYNYLLENSLREAPVLKELREVTSKLPNARMQISPEQGQFMALLLQLMGAKQVVEIGTYTGYSSLVMALSLPEDGQVITCDINEENTKIAQKFWDKAAVQHKIKLELGEAKDSLQYLLDAGMAGKFDFAFIDADKQNNLHYYEQCYKLLRPGGVIAIDNTLWSGKVADSEVHDASTLALREFNEKLHADERIVLSLVPIGDGLTLALKE